MTDRKYSIAEIDQMRDALEGMYGAGPYDALERSAEVEDRLRTHMQNGTDPAELDQASYAFKTREYEARRERQKLDEERRRAAPPPRELKTKEDVIDEWYQTCVAHFPWTSDTAAELYDGFSGKTLKAFANKYAPDGVNIRQRDMERFLDKKGIKTRHAMFAKRYDGIRHIDHGDVRTGNYGT